MKVQIPKSIKSISSQLSILVLTHKARCLEMLPVEIQLELESKCNHELFYQDANRFMEDSYQDFVNKGKIEVNIW